MRETLQYRLALNPDGSIADVEPIGQAAIIFQERAAIPPVGTPFVSPLPAEIGSPTIRLVLRPDGTVRTFLEPNSVENEGA